MKTLKTNADGRTDPMVLVAAEARVGEYELALVHAVELRHVPRQLIRDLALSERAAA